MIHGLRKICNRLFFYKMELSIMPDNYNSASKQYISDVLDLMGRNHKYITVLDQPYEACEPIRSFKYFDNPKAIIVDRDPRDYYILLKEIKRKLGLTYQVPCDTVDKFIEYYKLVRKSLPDIKEQKDVLFVYYEEFVYDYENAVEKIVNFTGLNCHSRKGNYFSPLKARDTTELFKKHKEFEADIAKIEQELSEYLFHFDSYKKIGS